MDRARGESVGTKRDFRDREKADLWHSEQPLVFMWLGKQLWKQDFPGLPRHASP